MKTYLIYKATCIETNKSYIGYTNSIKGFERRKYEHYNNGFNGHKSKFYNALRKYPDKFEWTILVDSIKTHEEAKIKEIELISEFDTYRNGYNSTMGGDGGDLSEHREYKRKKIEDVIQKDIILMYTNGIGKAEIRRKYPELTINMITKILEWNNISPLPPINQRNKKEENYKEPHKSYIGENNSRFVFVEEDTKIEMIRLYQTREMTKNDICIHYNIGNKVLNRIFKEFNIEKNKPLNC